VEDVVLIYVILNLRVVVKLKIIIPVLFKEGKALNRLSDFEELLYSMDLAY
jgi:hypothetical protein